MYLEKHIWVVQGVGCGQPRDAPLSGYPAGKSLLPAMALAASAAPERRPCLPQAASTQDHAGFSPRARVSEEKRGLSSLWGG